MNKNIEKAIQAVKEELQVNTKIESNFGMNWSIEEMLYKPLIAKGLEHTDVHSAVRFLLDDGKYLYKSSNIGNALLTPDGWQWVFGSINIDNQNNSNQGFIAVWFDGLMADSIVAITEAIKESGYDPMCIKDEHFSEKIMDKALSEIRKSKFVIVDLTGNRNSVFFEAGFAFGLDIEAIYVYNLNSVEEGSSLEFYVKHYKCYGYKNTKDLKEMLKNAIGARIKK